MPVSKRRAPKVRLSRVAIERREQILRGACDVITREGFAKATVRQIADAAGMPVPTMYQYVRSKEEILAMIYQRFLEEINQRLAASLQPGGSPRQKVVALIRATAETFDHYHAYVKLLFRETKSLGPKARQQVFDLDLACIATWTSTLESAAAGGLKIRNPELVANLIYYLCTVWAIRHWAIGKYGFERVLEGIADLVLGGLGDEQLDR